MLLVLSVLMVIVAIAIPGYQNFSVKKEEQRFFDVLQQDVYYAQSQSYSLQKPTKIVFRDAKKVYELFTDLQSVALSRKIPDSVTLQKTSTLDVIHFNLNGAIVQSGTFHFATSSGEKVMVVHLGKGRVVFSE